MPARDVKFMGEVMVRRADIFPKRQVNPKAMAHDVLLFPETKIAFLYIYTQLAPSARDAICCRYPFLLHECQSQAASALNKIFAKGQINSPTWRIT